MARAEHGAPLARELLLDLHQLFTLRRIGQHSGLLVGSGELTADQAVELAAPCRSSRSSAWPTTG